MLHSRRDLGKFALGGLSAAGLLARSGLAFDGASAKPNSKWAGVQVGLNVPYSFGTRTAMSGDDVLERCIELGVSGVELRAQAIEKSCGLPAELVLGPAPSDYQAVSTPVGEVPGVWTETRASSVNSSVEARQRAAMSRRPQTPEELAAYNAAAGELRKWRLSLPMSKAADVRKKYKDGGVAIEIVKFDGIADLTGDELDYAFTLAKALGARAISGEVSMPSVKRLGEAADRHKMPVGLHGHLAITPALWEQAFSYAKYNFANVDIGHFVAGNNTSPLPFIQQYHNRITHIHVKDRKMHGGGNVAFGQGDTPIKAVLQAMRDNHWPFQATIEFEIPLPPEADRNAEIRKCLEYCKNCLLG
ncbi:MAG: sugar phosphate isomerase/epimerase family protein [Bryobacteraceae bacterium]